jgi:hypothetical protein
MKKIVLPVSDSLKAKLDQKKGAKASSTTSFARCWSGRWPTCLCRQQAKGGMNDEDHFT